MGPWAACILLACSPQSDGEGKGNSPLASRSESESSEPPAQRELYVEVRDDGARVVDAQVAVWAQASAGAPPHEGATAPRELEEALAHGRTDPYGVFAVPELADGEYVVGARSNPYEAWVRTAARLSAERQVFRVSLPAGEIRFRTLDPRGRPIRAAAALVEVRPPGESSWRQLDERTQEARFTVARMGSDDAGRGTLQRVPPGRYWLSFWSERDGAAPLFGRSDVVVVNDGMVDAGTWTLEPVARAALSLGGLDAWSEHEHALYLRREGDGALVTSLRRARWNEVAGRHEGITLLPAGDYRLVIRNARREVLWRSERFAVRAGERADFRCDLSQPGALGVDER